MGPRSGRGPMLHYPERRMMRVTYIGNFGAPHSTETHVARALEANGVTVHRIQETDDCWDEVPHVPAAFVMWTTTHDYAARSYGEQHHMLANLDVPIVGYHLDRWWGLNREGRIAKEPFFRCDLVVTADGGHDRQWEQAGVNHHWLPPAVSEAECEPGRRNSTQAARLGFVGSWQGGYHREWKHRQHLVDHLAKRGCRFWPEKGKPAVRGEALRNLYASVDVLVGDSCLAGGATHYWSDRIPETLGRGGFLLHPEVEGLDDHFTPGAHLMTWPAGDWDRLDHLIDAFLDDDIMRQQIAGEGRRHVLAHHTYEVRMRQLFDVLVAQGLLEQGEVAA